MMETAAIVGQTLQHYRILELIGAGGMGAVYRALDVRLDREVAVKMLLPAFAGDAVRLQRFEREARALAAISHPNLLAIYDVGMHEGSPYIVCELLEGETLRRVLLSGPLPMHRAVDYSLQIVRGLMAAHGKGIVHRDLKPENIFITTEGQVKILDMGLAKLTQPEGTPASDVLTMTTSASLILGTLGYMSPEQIRGQAVDHRTDIFAFGTVFYEMVTGKRAFQGHTAADTMSAILNQEAPSPSDTRPSIPPAVDRILRHCLEKNVDDRFQSARELAFNLEGVSSPSTLTMAARRSVAVLTKRKKLAFFALMGILLMVLLGFAVLPARWSAQRLPSYHQLTFRHGSIWSARFAADAQTIVYAASWAGKPLEIFLTPPGSTESRPLGMENTELLAVSNTGEMAILLNRRQVAQFLSRGTLARMSLGGGAPREILDDVQQADWSPDGTNLAVVHAIGNVERLEYPIGKTLYETTGWMSYPRISPKGDQVAFMEHHDRWDDRGWVSVVDLNGKKKVVSEEWASEYGLAWAADGNELWFTANRSGEAFALYATNVSGTERVLARVPADLLLHDVAPNGTALLSSETYSTPVIALPPGQSTERDISELDGVAIFDISDDGKTFVFQYYGQGSGINYSSYLGKTDGSPAVRLGEGAAVALSPDGKWVVSILNKPRQTLLVPTGSGPSRGLERGGLRELGDDHFAPDGEHVLFTGQKAGEALRSYIQDIHGGRPKPLTPPGVTGTLLSPNGEFLLTTGANGKRSVFSMKGGEVREIPGLSEGDEVVRWGADGWLLCVNRSRLPLTIFALDPATGKTRPIRSVVPSDPVGFGKGQHLHLSADGKSYVYVFQRTLSKLYLVKGLQ